MCELVGKILFNLGQRLTCSISESLELTKWSFTMITLQLFNQMLFSVLWVEKLVHKGKVLNGKMFAKPLGIWLRYVHYAKHSCSDVSSKAPRMHMSWRKTATPCRTCWSLAIVSVERKWSWVHINSGSLCPDPSLMMSYDWNVVFPKTVIKVRQEERKRKAHNKHNPS